MASADLAQPPSPTRVYRPAPDVCWAVETHGLLLRDGRQGVRAVPYPEAAIWDLMSRGYRYDKVVTMLSWIAGLDCQASRELLDDTLTRWCRAGLLVREDGHG